MKRITFEEIQKFKNHLIEEEKSASTLEKYTRDITVFKNWLGSREITKYNVIEYKNFLTQSYAPASVNSILSSLNSFFVYNGLHECRVKTLKIQRKVFTDKSKELTKKEYEKLLNAAQAKNNKQLYYLIQTICSSGLRVSELKFVDANAIKSGQAYINCKGKIRLVILPKELCKMLNGYMKERNIVSGPVFISKNGKNLDRSNIWKTLKKLCDAAGVSKDKVFPHNLRHLFARTYYSVQKDIVRLADILGHTNVNTTRIYTIESGAVHRRHIEKLGLLRY